MPVRAAADARVADHGGLVAWCRAERDRLRAEWLAARAAREAAEGGGDWLPYLDACRSAGVSAQTPAEAAERAAWERLTEWEAVCRGYAESLRRAALDLLSGLET